MMLTCSFCGFTQAALESTEKLLGFFFFFSEAQHREAFHGLRIQGVTEFDDD
jgi:hypothetical protein